MGEIADDASKAVANLLLNCARGHFGQSVMIVHEPKDEQFYEPALPEFVADKVRGLGFEVGLHEVPFQEEVKDPSPELINAMNSVDHTIFLARLGDQMRFREIKQAGSKIISYALDRDMLVSGFGTADYRGFEALKSTINKAIVNADEIHVTCPEGTDYKGYVKDAEEELVDVSLKRFPMSIFTPVPARHFQGQIAQVGFLTGTGSQYYTPYACEIEKVLFIEFDGNVITGFSGSETDVASAEGHYNFVANKFGIDPFYVHSWHAGIQPACAFPMPAAESFERWSGGAFGNPRLLHFHTCGQYPPGEISINFVDPTIMLDDQLVWEEGTLYPERLSGGAEILDAYPSLRKVFQEPSRDIGLGKAGRLSFT